MVNSTVLKTDKYEYTMLQAALKSGVAHRKAVFELFTRSLPAGRTYGVVAGTARALQAVREFRFTKTELDILSEHVNQQTIDYLKNFRFNGTIYGYPEGELFFPLSPVITIEATFGEAVLFETILLSIFNYDCAVASQASRIRVAAKDVPLQELGSRRVNEDAAVAAARAAYIAGWNGTSNLLAETQYGIPAFGTSAHAYTLAHEDELEAFRQQVLSLGTSTTLLVDTYDIEQGIRHAILTGSVNLGAIRIDSGDPFVEIPAARELLDELGATKTRIIFSGDLDLETVEAITEADLPVDGFGVGSAVVTGGGYPNCGFVYKLVEVEYDDGEMHPVAKKSSSKSSVGGRKTVYRGLDDDWKVESENLFISTPNPSVISGLNAVQELFVYKGNSLMVDLTVDRARTRHADNLRTIKTGREVNINIL